MFLFVSNHSLRQLKWMHEIVPVHLQGEIRGLNGFPGYVSSSPPQQILHYVVDDDAIDMLSFSFNG
jgi:hypothetical protein